MVSIAAFQAVDPGSIPGRRNFFSIYNQMCKGSCVKFMNPGVNVPRGLTARISGFHPGGPGSTPGVGRHFAFWLDKACGDEVAEWLRRWTANPMGSARVGSNPILVGIFEKKFRYRELNPGHLGESQVS